MACEAFTVITGAAQGIGANVAARFAGEGRKLLLVDLDPAVERVGAELGAATAILDVTDPDAWAGALAGVSPSALRIDALVACAGVLGAPAHVSDLAVADWRRVIDVNLTGVFVTCQAVLPALIANGGGSIVNIASIAGKEGNAGQSAYSAAKGGVIALTKSLAKEVVDRGVTVNCIAPTVIEGPFADRMSDALKQSLLARIPMRRFGCPGEVAALASWICSPECSFTTGFCFDLSGGRATY